MPKRPTALLRVTCELLEDRLALSGNSTHPIPLPSIKSHSGSVSVVSSVLHRGTLTILGTSSSDTIHVRSRDGRVAVAGTSYAWERVKRVVIASEEGADVIVVQPRVKKPCQIFAGAGDDKVMSGNGDDEIYGDGGIDTIHGGGGDDMIYGGGNEDNLEGGAGSNKLIHEVPFRGDSPSDISSEVLRLINVERGRLGLKGLAFDSQLIEASDVHSENMAHQSERSGPDDALRHTLSGVDQPTLSSRLDYAGFSGRTASENIAFGYETAAEVVKAWMDSPGHRVNILSADAALTGIAVRANTDGVLFYCQVFAAKK